MARPKNPDFRIRNEGTVVLFTPLTARGHALVEEAIAPNIESWQWMGKSFAVDHRVCEALIRDIVESGCSVQ